MKKKISILLLILWAILIFYLSSQPSDISSKSSSDMIEYVFKVDRDTIDIINNPMRELMHFLEYFIFGTLTYNVLIKYRVKKILIITILISLLYIISDEVHQIFVPGRAFELIDIILDFLGALLGSLLYNLFSKKYIQKNKTIV